MKTKRQALGLAAVLAATVLTGGGATPGPLLRPVAAAPAAPMVVQQAPPAAPAWSDGGDN